MISILKLKHHYNYRSVNIIVICMKVNQLHAQAKERAYYMYINGDVQFNNDYSRYIAALEIEEHIENDKKINMKFQQWSDAELLTENQINALKFINEKCKKRHFNVIRNLNSIVPKANALISKMFTDIPLYINFPISHINKIANDTHYRNQFETGTSSGTLNRLSRSAWENRLFSDTYTDATDFERPKYGNFPINNQDAAIYRDINRRTTYYGLMYFVLKYEVKQRTTITYGDSNSQTYNTVGNFNYPCDILNDKSHVLSHIYTHGYSSSATYFEIQIHGPVRLDTDIESLHYPSGCQCETMYNNAFELFKKKGIQLHTY